MIGIVDVAVQAASPNLPLYPFRAFVNSPSSVRIRNVPRKVGDWQITAVQLVAAYPDNTVRTVDCKLIGSVWVGTIQGSSSSGKSENGYTVYASGTDENGNPMSNYALGKGSVEILEIDGTITPGVDTVYVHLYDAEPTTPKDGDLWPDGNGGYLIYQDGETHAIGGGSSITVDDELSETSENPVQNKVVTSALNGKATSTQGAKADAALSRAEAVAGFTEWTYTGLPVGAVVPEDGKPSYADGYWSFSFNYNGTTFFNAGESGSEDATSITFLCTDIDNVQDPITVTATRTRLPTMADIPTDNAQLTNGAGYATTTAMNTALAGKADASSLPYALVTVVPTAGAPFVLAACFPIVYTPDGGSSVTITSDDADGLIVELNEADDFSVKYNGSTIFVAYPDGTFGYTHNASITFNGDEPTEEETQVLGFTPTYALADRAINAVTLTADATLAFPAQTAGKALDFLVRLTIPAGDAPQIAYPEGVTFENADGSFPEINTDESAAASTLLMFTETAPAVTGVNATPARFLVKGEALKEVS